MRNSPRFYAIPKGFYVYAYLREIDSKDCEWMATTPYYIGKGCFRRAWSRTHRDMPVPKNLDNIVILADGLKDQEARDLEALLIKRLGRADLGKGCLRNFTDGGDGAAGYRRSEALRAKDRENCIKYSGTRGKKPWNHGLKLPYYPHHKKRGAVPWNRGVRATPELLAKFSAAQKGHTRGRGKKSRNATSKYHGVNWDDRTKNWCVCLRLKEKTIHIGKSNDEVVAAKLWDRYIVENQIDRPVNFPGEQIHIDQRRKKTGKRWDSQSTFYGVCWRHDIQRWRVTFRANGKTLNGGSHDTEILAAHAHDKLVRELGIDRPLNFPEVA